MEPFPRILGSDLWDVRYRPARIKIVECLAVPEQRIMKGICQNRCALISPRDILDRYATSDSEIDAKARPRCTALGIQLRTAWHLADKTGTTRSMPYYYVPFSSIRVSTAKSYLRDERVRVVSECTAREPTVVCCTLTRRRSAG